MKPYLFLAIIVCIASSSFSAGKSFADHWYASHELVSGTNVSSIGSIPAVSGEYIAAFPTLTCDVENGKVRAQDPGKTRDDCIAALIKEWQKQSVMHYDDWPGWKEAIPDAKRMVHGT